MFKIEISVLGSAWKTIHENVGNKHAAEVFAAKRASKNVVVRIWDVLEGRVVSVT